DDHSLDAAFPQHCFHVREWPHAVFRRELLGAIARQVARGDELRLGNRLQRCRVNAADFAATDETNANGSHASPGKYFATIRRRNASDSAISSRPFMPSSMLIQPLYLWVARMRKIDS